MGCHRSQRSSFAAFAILSILFCHALLFLEFLPGRIPEKEKEKEAA